MSKTRVIDALLEPLELKTDDRYYPYTSNTNHESWEFPESIIRWEHFGYKAAKEEYSEFLTVQVPHSSIRIPSAQRFVAGKEAVLSVCWPIINRLDNIFDGMKLKRQVGYVAGSLTPVVVAGQVSFQQGSSSESNSNAL